MKIHFHFFRNRKLFWCRAVNPFHFFLGWNENSIHINIPLLVCSLIIQIDKPKSL